MWIPITLGAAALQTGRTLLQHRLRALLSVSGAGFVRYFYGAPLSLIATALAVLGGLAWPNITWRFWPVVLAAGTAQILATACLIKAFDARDFAVGTVFSKTEVVMTALLSAAVLGEPLSVWGWVGVAVCMVGVALLAGGARVWQGWRTAVARWGVAAGVLFAVSAICIRNAATGLGDSPALMRAIVTLACMNTMQTLLHGAYLARRDRSQIRLVLVHWRSSAVVGVLSVCGSALWTLAFTLHNAAMVRAVGQVELIFTFLVSYLWLRERHSRADLLASGVLIAGVVLTAAAG
jgi:drug/metabolite transporter (DMT)-like permease